MTSSLLHFPASQTGLGTQTPPSRSRPSTSRSWAIRPAPEGTSGPDGPGKSPGFPAVTRRGTGVDWHLAGQPGHHPIRRAVQTYGRHGGHTRACPAAAPVAHPSAHVPRQSNAHKVDPGRRHRNRRSGGRHRRPCRQGLHPFGLAGLRGAGPRISTQDGPVIRADQLRLGSELRWSLGGGPLRL